jgi:predicted nucleic acid-binding protein
MHAVLIDTDVFSFLLKRDSRSAPYEKRLINSQVCLSFQTVAELRLWALVRHWAESRRLSREVALGRCLVLPFDVATKRLWAEITAQRRRAGRPIACGDAWVAAGALRHGLPLLTYNAADFGEISDLKVVCYDTR